LKRVSTEGKAKAIFGGSAGKSPNKKSRFLSKKKSGSVKTFQHESQKYFTTVPLPSAGITQFRF